MAKFFSIPGMAPSGGEGNMGGRPVTPVPEPTREQLESRYSDYYKNRGDVSTSAFATPGDEFKLHGDDAIVRHVEKNSDGSQELTVQRSVRGNSGTYQVKVKPDKNRSQVVTQVKRSFD